MTSTRAALALALVGALALSACGDDDPAGADTPAVSPTIIVGHTVDPLSHLLGEIYGQGLENSGLRIARKDGVADLDALHAAFADGSVHLAPESTVSLLERAGADIPDTINDQITAINESLPEGQSVQATTSVFVTDAVVCSTAAIDEFELSNVSDLAAAEGATLGGASSFETSSSFSLADLNTAYEAEFDFTATGDSDADVAAAIAAGEVDCGVVSSLAPQITIEGLLPLTDDLAAAPQDALLPLLGTPAATPEATAVIGQINALLTTDVVRALLVKMEVSGDSPAVTAKGFLASQSSS